LLEQVSSAAAAQNLTPIFAASSLVRCDALDEPADCRPDYACGDEFNPRRRQFKDLNECVADKSTATSKNLTRRANHRHIFIVASIEPAPGNRPRVFLERLLVPKEFDTSGKSPAYLHHRKH